MLEHGCITRSRIVGPITRHLVNGLGNLDEQSGQRLAVVDTTPGEFPRDQLMNFHYLYYPTTSLWLYLVHKGEAPVSRIDDMTADASPC
jgi:hypothetical protein